MLWLRLWSARVLDTAPAAMAAANGLYRAMGFVEVERYHDNPVLGIVFYRLEL